MHCSRRSALLPPQLATLARPVAVTSLPGSPWWLALTTTSALCASFAFLGLAAVFARLVVLCTLWLLYYTPGIRTTVCVHFFLWCCCCDHTRGGVRPRKWSYSVFSFYNFWFTFPSTGRASLASETDRGEINGVLTSVRLRPKAVLDRGRATPAPSLCSSGDANCVGKS
jgi:hypothetical protein